MITRRSIMRGLFAAPAVVAASSLMPLRGLVMPVSHDPQWLVWINDRIVGLPVEGLRHPAYPEFVFGPLPPLKRLVIDNCAVIDEMLEQMSAARLR